MISDIAGGIQELVDLADRGLSKIFSDPWPPVTSAVMYTRTPAGNRPVFQHIATRSLQTRQQAAQSSPQHHPSPLKSVKITTKVTNHRVAPATVGNGKRANVLTTSIPPKSSSSKSAPIKSTLRGSVPAVVRVKSSPRLSGGLKASDIRLDLDRCDVLVIAIAEMEICKEIFTGWSAQLDVAQPRRKDALEQSIVLTVKKLNDDATAALHSSHGLLQNYRSLVRTMERHLDLISRSKAGGSLYPSLELSGLSMSIATHSSTLTNHVKQMQERLRALVKDIESTREKATRRALRRRIWGWLMNAFRALSVLLSAGGTIFALFHPLGFLESSAIAAASMLSGAAAKLCEVAQQKYNETIFDEILVFLRDHVPESAKAAEIALTSFQACHRVLQVELEVRQGKRLGWMASHEAKQAHGAWKEADRKLQVTI